MRRENFQYNRFQIISSDLLKIGYVKKHTNSIIMKLKKRKKKQSTSDPI